jgi:hypothetical protein
MCTGEKNKAKGKLQCIACMPHCLPFALYLLPLILPFALSSCIEVEEYENNPRGNFEALWTIMDERYCFFEYKNVDWNQVHDNYSQRINDNMTPESLFMILNEMLQELKDGHVNLSTPFDVGRYWKWFEDYPSNYRQKLIDNYLGTDYRIASGIHYKVLPDNIMYLRYSDFSTTVGDTNLDYIIEKAGVCEGMIIDVRENGGGFLTNSTKIASRFFNETALVGYMQHKTGKGHNDFSKPYPQYIEPSKRLRYQKPVIVLTNRRCFSSTNDFVNSMSYAPNTTILGDATGGGSGLPFSSELPNGWSVRFSSCPILNADKEHIEFGIKPDIPVQLNPLDAEQGQDTLIETARRLIKE